MKPTIPCSRVTLTLQDDICRLVTVDVTMPTETAALENTTSAKTVYNAVNITLQHCS